MVPTSDYFVFIKIRKNSILGKIKTNIFQGKHTVLRETLVTTSKTSLASEKGIKNVVKQCSHISNTSVKRWNINNATPSIYFLLCCLNSCLKKRLWLFSHFSEIELSIKDKLYLWIKTNVRTLPNTFPRQTPCACVVPTPVRMSNSGYRETCMCGWAADRLFACMRWDTRRLSFVASVLETGWS